ncbi:MAG: IS4 family transposase [Synergistaceae bacterium]|nr:IS4 family transposase [Synergistaceae bacterium]
MLISQPFTLNAARFHSSYFTRVRKMTFQDIILFVLCGFDTCTRTALNRFFTQNSEQVMTMSQQALSKARSHFDHSPFELIFRDLVLQRYCEEHEINLWHGYQIFAIDKNDAALPKIPALLEAFGGTGRDADSPTAKISLLCDVLNDFVVDAAIGRASASERGFALGHLEKLKDICPDTKKILIFDIFDRSYPLAALINALNAQRLSFLMRVKSKWNQEINESTRADSLVKLDETTTIRAVKFQLPSGETETLITNLYELPFKEFSMLYFKRWPIETKYDIVKNKLTLENFTGYSKNVILQDFWAAMYLTNLAAVAKDEADAKKTGGI